MLMPEGIGYTRGGRFCSAHALHIYIYIYNSVGHVIARAFTGNCNVHTPLSMKPSNRIFARCPIKIICAMSSLLLRYHLTILSNARWLISRCAQWGLSSQTFK